MLAKASQSLEKKFSRIFGTNVIVRARTSGCNFVTVDINLETTKALIESSSDEKKTTLLHPDKDTHWSYKNSDLFKQCRSCGDLSYHTMLECHGRLHEETSGVFGNGCVPRRPFGLCLLLGRSVRSPVPSTSFATMKKHRRRRREFPFHIELELD